MTGVPLPLTGVKERNVRSIRYQMPNDGCMYGNHSLFRTAEAHRASSEAASIREVRAGHASSECLTLYVCPPIEVYKISIPSRHDNYVRQ